MQKLITIKKRGGGTRKQLVQVLKSGKFKFLKMSKRRKSSGSSKSKKKNKSKKKKHNNPGHSSNRGHRSLKHFKFKAFLRGLLGGGGGSQLASDGVGLITEEPVAVIPVKIIGAVGASYFVSQKDEKTEGIIGGLTSVGIDLLLSFFARGGSLLSPGISRAGRL